MNTSTFVELSTGLWGCSWPTTHLWGPLSETIEQGVTAGHFCGSADGPFVQADPPPTPKGEELVIKPMGHKYTTHTHTCPTPHYTHTELVLSTPHSSTQAAQSPSLHATHVQCCPVFVPHIKPLWALLGRQRGVERVGWRGRRCLYAPWRSVLLLLGWASEWRVGYISLLLRQPVDATVLVFIWVNAHEREEQWGQKQWRHLLDLRVEFTGHHHLLGDIVGLSVLPLVMLQVDWVE